MLPSRYTTAALLFVSAWLSLTGCDSQEPPVPELPPDFTWLESGFPPQAHSPRAVISAESGEVYANFNGTGDHLFRVRGPGWIAEPLPERYDARFGNLYPSAMPGGGYAVVVEDDGGGGPQEESGTRVLTSSAGEGWSAVGVALPRLVLSGTHGVASNGAGTALLVAQGGEQGTTGTLYRTTGAGGAWAEATPVAGLTPAGPPVFADEQTAFVNGADNADVGNYPHPAATWTLLRSMDAGATWAPTSLPQASAYYAVRRGPNGALLAFAESRLYVSRDVGRTWDPIPTPASGDDVAEAALTPSGGYLIVTRRLEEGTWHGDVALYYSASEGAEWVEAGAGLGPLISDPYLTTVGSPIARYGGDTSLARDAEGYFYLVLYRERGGLTRSTLVRTEQPVP